MPASAFRSLKEQESKLGCIWRAVLHQAAISGMDSMDSVSTTDECN